MTPAPPDGGGGFNILQSLQNAFTTFLNYVPNVIGALLVLLIGFIIARLIRAGISGLLRKARVDDKLTHGKGGEYVARFSPQGKPSQLVGLVVQYVLMVFVIVSAVGTLNIPAVTGFVTLVLSYLPNVIAALLIFLVAAAIAAAVGGLVHRTMGDTPTGRVARSAAPTLVMAIAVFMILNQLGIAEVIVTISGAIWSWLRIMKTAIAITSTGTTEPTTLPVGVSPIVRATNPAIAAAIAPATTKMSTAAITFGR